ncbi:sigma-70 family RNA polymerase sigma factor [Aureliella helgolandensis]|uniref:RNA polymerase sigma factor n=1 Tax=Aureliella helgolandensis TaxID=2527968 RepID=A0A518G6G7_9BACT|nr:sigma-70 family RNA polymerase sigma factor [Aureliella helgolandensis]QDV24183.1 RNA polymerase sigma factor [Aureliella helgolandensis]
MDHEPEREQRYREFVALLTRHDLSIRRFVRSLLPSRDGVDDVVQDTALECWKKFSEFNPERSEESADGFIRWACVIARYKAMSWQRNKARDRLVFRETVIERLAQAALDNLDQQQMEQSAIEVCLGKLQEDQRRLVLSVHSPGESIANIAQETGEAARRLYRKVNVLRKRLLECVAQRIAAEVSNG